MSIQKTFPFTTPSNYTYDSSKVEIAGGVAKLKLVDLPNQDFQETFDSDSGFTYDSDKAEFSGGQLQQKEYLPANSVLGANYTLGPNANFGISTLTGTLFNGATVSGGRLDCTGANGGVYYFGENLDTSKLVGTIKFKFTVGATGMLNGYLFRVRNDSFNNVFEIYTTSPTNFRFTHRNDSGTIIADQNVAETLTAGQTYEIEYCYDCTNQKYRLFKDGVLRCTQDGNTGGNPSTIVTDFEAIFVGAGSVGVSTTNGYFDDVLLFSTYNHDAGYTPGYTVPTYKYAITTVTAPTFIATGPGVLQSIESFTITNSGTPRFTIGTTAGTQFYWDTGAGEWAVSDQTYTQASPPADVIAHLAELLVTEVDQLVYKIYFTESNIQSNVSEIDIEYTGQIYPTDNPTITINETWRMEGLEGFVETSTVAGSDAISYYLKKGTTKYYYNSGWVESDGTYSQSTSAADIETNKATFTTSIVTFGIVLFLHSDDGTTTPEIDLLATSYDYAGETPDAISTCIVYGYSKNGDGSVNNDPITFELSKDYSEYKTNTIIHKSTLTATPESSGGYYEIDLVENENMDAGTQYKVTQSGKVDYITVPNETTKALNDLLG